MPATTNFAVAGVVLTDATNRPVMTVGIGSDPRVKSLATDKVWMGDIRNQRLTTLNLDRKVFTVLLIPMEQGELLVFSNAPGDSLLNFIGSVDFAWDIFQHLLTDPFDGMTVVDKNATSSTFPPFTKHSSALNPETELADRSSRSSTTPGCTKSLLPEKQKSAPSSACADLTASSPASQSSAMAR